MDFETELNKLLSQQNEPLPQIELVELMAAGRQLLHTLNKKQSEISMQIEEIYDITKEADNSVIQDTLRDEKSRSNRLVGTAVKLCDLIEDFYEYAQRGSNEELAHQALLMRKNADAFLRDCGLTRFGDAGEQLNPDIHSVRSSAISSIPREYVVKVLQSGYRYLGAIIRKAAVVVSLGKE